MSFYNPFCVSQHRHSSLISNAESQELPRLSQTGTTGINSAWKDFFTRSMVFINRTVGYKLHNLPYDIPATKRTRAEFLNRITQWHGVFRKLCDDADMPLEEETRLCFQLARIHLQFCHVFLECCLDASELSYDGFEPVFRELLHRCEALTGKSPTFELVDKLPTSISAGLVPALVFVAAKCRVHKIRLSAIEMLGKLPRLEDMWDIESIVAGHLAQVKLEESGAGQKGTIPPLSRYVWSASSWDAESGKLWAFFTRAVPTEQGKPYRVEVELEV